MKTKSKSAIRLVRLQNGCYQVQTKNLRWPNDLWHDEIHHELRDLAGLAEARRHFEHSIEFWKEQPVASVIEEVAL